jgi:hypothetical protein
MEISTTSTKTNVETVGRNQFGINLDKTNQSPKKIKKDDSEELHEELPLKTSEVLSEGSARIHHSEDVCCCLDF